MNSKEDPALRALARLRDAHAEPAPDSALEARLRARFRPARSWRPRLLGLVAVGALSGVAFASLGGMRWLRSWIYTVEVDGQRVEGVVDGEGERTHTFEGSDGTTTTVQVARELLPDAGERTRIAVDRVGDGQVQREQTEDVVGGTPRRTWPRTLVQDATPVYEGLDDQGRSISLYALPGESSAEPDARLFLARDDIGTSLVEELGRAPGWLLDPERSFTVRARAGGGLRFTQRGPLGEEYEFELLVAPARAPGTSTLETPDGPTRVHIEDGDQ